MRFVVGLGNPGIQYARTRHNVGFAVIEELAQRWHLQLSRLHDGLRTAHGTIAGTPTTLVQPHMYMNLSGSALRRLEYSVESSNLVVIHDDLDLEPGCIRVKHGGGTAGHHGLDSIVEEFDDSFIRVRVGIGRPPRDAAGADYVLSEFAAGERDVMHAALRQAADAVECILNKGHGAAMNTFNVRQKSAPLATAAPMGRK